MVVQQRLTNLQHELIKLYSTELGDDELVEVKKVLAEFFAQKAVKEADQIWDERNFTDNEMDS